MALFSGAIKDYIRQLPTKNDDIIRAVEDFNYAVQQAAGTECNADHILLHFLLIS